MRIAVMCSHKSNASTTTSYCSTLGPLLERTVRPAQGDYTALSACPTLWSHLETPLHGAVTP